MGISDFLKQAKDSVDAGIAKYEQVKQVASQLTKGNQIPPVVINFDSDWFMNWEMLRERYEGKSVSLTVSVHFPDGLVEEIAACVRDHTESPRIPYSPNKTPITCVGESFRRESLREFCNGRPGDEMPWLAGFLMPEMNNSFDKNAVAIYAISVPVDSSDSEEKEVSVVHCGYMAAEDAKKAHKKILKLLTNNQYVPLLLRFTGGEGDKHDYGVFPYAMTEAIKF